MKLFKNIKTVKMNKNKKNFKWLTVGELYTLTDVYQTFPPGSSDREDFIKYCVKLDNLKITTNTPVMLIKIKLTNFNVECHMLYKGMMFAIPIQFVKRFKTLQNNNDKKIKILGLKNET
jgi:hypothetical protein